MSSHIRFSLGKSIIGWAKIEFIRAFLRFNDPLGI
jgi:hypothetical protein